MEKQTLSDKIIPFRYKRKDDGIQVENVKEFIKELKEIVCNKGYVIKEDEIDKLAGEKLI